MFDSDCSIFLLAFGREECNSFRHLSSFLVCMLGCGRNMGLVGTGSLLPHCGRRAGDEGRNALLIAVGGRAQDRMEGSELAARVIDKSGRRNGSK